MDKKLAVLTVAFAICAGLVFAQEMKADAPAADDAMMANEEMLINEEMNGENAEMNADLDADMDAETNAEENAMENEEAAPAAAETKY